MNITVIRELDTIDVTYDNLIEIANDIFESTCKEFDELMV